MYVSNTTQTLGDGKVTLNDQTTHRGQLAIILIAGLQFVSIINGQQQQLIPITNIYTIEPDQSYYVNGRPRPSQNQQQVETPPTEHHHRNPLTAKDARKEAILSAQQIYENTNTVYVAMRTTHHPKDTANSLLWITIIDAEGYVELDTAINAGIPIPKSASDYHGIVDVGKAPSFSDAYQQIHSALTNKQPVVWSGYEETLIHAECDRIGKFSPVGKWVRLVPLYAKFHGKYDPLKRDWQWQKRKVALSTLGIEAKNTITTPNEDARQLRSIIQNMASAHSKDAENV